MKVISDEDLLSLHYQIEKAEVKQRKLEEQLDYNLQKLKNTKRATRIIGIVAGVFLLLSLLLLLYSYFGSGASEKISDQIEMASLKSELSSLQGKFVELEKEKADLEVVKDLYLYRDLIEKDTVYSVQINAFSGNKITALSDKYINGRVYSDTSFFKLSLGIFETLTEAQEFRKTLIGSGFSDRIFVISYKDGQRLKIENSIISDL